MDSLIGVDPAEVLIHGSSKRYVDKYLWHSAPFTTVVGCYTPVGKDVEDHFGVFRGVDQIESFGQTLGSISTYLETIKQKISYCELKQRFTPAFISIGRVNFHSYVKEGETLVNIACSTFYKYRQMVGGGRVYKAPEGLDLETYFDGIEESSLLKYEFRDDFVLIAEIENITGRLLNNEKRQIANL